MLSVLTERERAQCCQYSLRGEGFVRRGAVLSILTKRGGVCEGRGSVASTHCEMGGHSVVSTYCERRGHNIVSTH